MANSKHEWFRLNIKIARRILIYLTILTILSFLFLLVLLIKEINILKDLSILSYSIISSVGASILGSSIFYSRKLYKACVNLDMLEPESESDKIRQLGIFSYYLLRPLYAACLSIFTCVVMKSGTEFIAKNGEVNENFPFLVIIVTFFVGYSSGDFIDYLEVKGKKVVEGVLKSDN